MNKSELDLYNLTSKSPKSLKQFLVVIGLMAAALLMICAWIMHLKWINVLSWQNAYFVSIAFVLFEYLFNTVSTRYGEYTKVFSPGQMATLSIVFGVFFTFIISVFFFDEKDKILQDFIGFLLLSAGSSFILLEKIF